MKYTTYSSLKQSKKFSVLISHKSCKQNCHILHISLQTCCIFSRSSLQSSRLSIASTHFKHCPQFHWLCVSLGRLATSWISKTPRILFTILIWNALHFSYLASKEAKAIFQGLRRIQNLWIEYYYTWEWIWNRTSMSPRQ